MNRYAPACLVILFSAANAGAITFDVNGKVDGWNVTPFSAPNGSATAGGVTSIRQNNISSISYPGIGAVPSPGGTTGERFDIEEVHVRNVGTRVEMLVFASSAFQATAGGSTLNLGDMLLNIDGDSAFELGVVTQSGNAGLDSGRLYEVNGTTGLQNLPGSYFGTAIAAEVGPWAITSGVGHDQFAIELASFDYGGSEGLTHVYQYTFELDFLANVPSHIDFQLAWGCGNDVFRGGFNLAPRSTGFEPPTPLPNNASAIPEPAALVLLMAGIGAVAGRWRRAMRT